jgi:hypothetical protein
MTKQMVTEFTLTPTEQAIWENGKMICSTEKAEKPGLMDLNTMESIVRARSLDLASTGGRMAPYTKVTGSIIESRVRVLTFGLTAADMKVDGSITICMDAESTFGRTVEDMKGITLRTKSTGLELTSGQMAVFMKEIGLRASSMAKESI